MEKPGYKTLLLVVLFIAAMLYGASYQQFRHFDLEQPAGLSDAQDYVRMEQGDLCSVPPTRRHRFIVPFLAAAVKAALPAVLDRGPGTPRPDEAVKLSFYIVNFIITCGVALVFFLMLRELGFDSYLGLIGVAMFLCSRITIINAATPVVDSLYFFAVALIFYLMLTERLILLALLNPLLVLSKETIIPIMLLPLLKGRRRAALGVSLAASLGVFYASREVVTSRCAAVGGSAGAAAELWEVLRLHFERHLLALSHIPLLHAIHDLQNGFSLFLILAAAGWMVNRKSRRYNIPGYFWWVVPLSLFYAALSLNMGRMFFASFVVIIPCALIFIEHVLRRPGDSGAPADRA